MAVSPSPNVAFCPKLRRERLVVVFREAFSKVFSTSSYCSASKCSLLNNCMDGCMCEQGRIMRLEREGGREEAH